MKRNTNKMLKAFYAHLENIFVLIDEYISDDKINKKIKRYLVNSDITDLELANTGIKVITDSKRNLSFELKFIPSIESFEKIEFYEVNDSMKSTTTISFDNKIVKIDEIIYPYHGLKHTISSNRVFVDNELKYSYSEYRYVYEKETEIESIEYFIDENTLKARVKKLSKDEEKNCKYYKKTLKHSIPYKNKREKIKFEPSKIYRLNLDECSENEFKTFMEYWKEINTLEKQENITLSKKKDE